MNSNSLNAADLMEWLPQLLQTNDSFFPSGTFAHSFGLEGLVHLGHVGDQADFGNFISEQVVPALEHFELPFVRLAHDAARNSAVAKLVVLDERYGAMKGSSELREASRRIGSQRLQMLARLRPHPLLAQLEAEQTARQFQAHGAIIFGAQTALDNTPVEAALLGYYYQTLAGLVSAALKLIRIGQVAGQLLLSEHLRQASKVMARSQRIREADIGWFQPVLDIASMRHETAYSRIFIS